MALAPIALRLTVGAVLPLAIKSNAPPVEEMLSVVAAAGLVVLLRSKMLSWNGPAISSIDAELWPLTSELNVTWVVLPLTGVALQCAAVPALQLVVSATAGGV